ncbi:outer membrane transport energization protein TonB [Roseovarius lutimaris]|uniref:Outer membrane transport energization protein TonB n=1 Tax=Roseovarius lutimaris TaxID=1005928 RepID=A0A1I5C6I3_9RHOB|nr:cell envelope integrity protein TolA [Roseovarius lutimaris]SFN82436.1 outer membrane transport energization protein TonB [Roseovarius lutimaris]
MTRGSVFAAVAAILLSLLLHALGLSFTSSENRPSSNEDTASDLADAGGTFEDFAGTPAEPAAPEEASAPDPPSVTSPEQVIEETSTSQALVASDNPQNVISPDTGEVEVLEPDTAEPSESDVPAPETAERSGGEDDDLADLAISQPVEPETEPDAAEGAPDATDAQASEVAPVSVTETVSPVVPAPAPSPSPAILPEPQVQEPVQPEITVTSAPDDPEILSAEEETDLTRSAVTTSLRPPKERPSVAAGQPNGTQPRSTRTRRSNGAIESPLTAYKRTGVDPFASRSGGSRSGTTGFSGARNPGNSSTTNYVGRVLVQLNRAPVVYPSAHGTAQVSFEINPDGTVAWVNILNSTGSGDIGRAASAQVRSAAPFPRPPDGTSQRLAFLYRNR